MLLKYYLEQLDYNDMPLFLKKENILWDIRNKTVSL